MIPVPYFQQETRYTCCAAGARMMIAFYKGSTPLEEEVAAMLKCTPNGGCIFEEVIRYLTAHGLAVEHQQGFSSESEALQRLEEIVGQGKPVFARVDSATYDAITPRVGGQEIEGRRYYWHMVIITGIDNEFVDINDPHQAMGRIQLPIDTFLEAWYHTLIKGDIGFVQ